MEFSQEEILIKLVSSDRSSSVSMLWEEIFTDYFCFVLWLEVRAQAQQAKLNL
jgi:hypothetical protein